MADPNAHHASPPGGHGEGEWEPWRRDRYGSLYDQDQVDYGSGYDDRTGEYGRGVDDRTSPQRAIRSARYANLDGREAREAHDHTYRSGGFEPAYLQWRDEQLRRHDRDYEAWRRERSRLYDEDYRRSRRGR